MHSLVNIQMTKVSHAVKQVLEYVLNVKELQRCILYHFKIYILYFHSFKTLSSELNFIMDKIQNIHYKSNRVRVLQ